MESDTVGDTVGDTVSEQVLELYNKVLDFCKEPKSFRKLEII